MSALQLLKEVRNFLLTRKLGTQRRKEFWRKMFVIKQTLVFVVCCRRTQMQLVNLALRFHKQKESSAHVGSGKQAVTTSRKETLM